MSVPRYPGRRAHWSLSLWGSECVLDLACGAKLADFEGRKRDRRQLEIQGALRALPILQQQLAAVEAMVDSAGPPVGLLVEPDLTHAGNMCPSFVLLQYCGGGDGVCLASYM